MLEPFLRELFETRGAAYYGAESVSQLQHALQTAHLAEIEGGSGALVVAGFLHDIGHLLGRGDEGLAQRDVDARHEVSGARVLGRWFGPELTEPVRLHVQAKSYLCFTDPGYRRRLSRASRDSLAVQGGVLDERQARAFEQTPYADDAVRLREWDDRAKDPDARTPPMDYYIAVAKDLAEDSAGNPAARNEA